MKILSLFKSIPFLSTLIILILLCTNNQSKDTRLKILIWDTPKFSIGTYIAISSGAGYFLSYIITSNIAKNNQLNINQGLKYKLNDKENEAKPNQDIDYNKRYDANLIERDLKDPSPTVNAIFRVISNNNINNQTLQDNFYKENVTSSTIGEPDNKYYHQVSNSKNDNLVDPTSNDWEDDTFINW